MKRAIRLTEEKLKNIVSETVKNFLRKDRLYEDRYSYNGVEYQKQLTRQYQQEIDKENNYKENIKRFIDAFKTVSRDYTIIDTLKRRKSTSETARRVFTIKRFMEYVKETEGEILYDKIWEKYGGEYEEIADQYLQYWVIKLRG